MEDILFDSRYLNPLTDFGFHKLFGTESSKELLIDFLNGVIREEGRITEMKQLTQEDMETYRKSILEYQDVRDAVDYAREEGREEGVIKGIEKGSCKRY